MKLEVDPRVAGRDGVLVEQERSALIGAEFCPFCAGHESMTPPEVLAFRNNGAAPNGPGWDLRVVPNKFPALQVEGGLDREGDGMFDRMNGIGAHEVIIETPDHAKTLASMSEIEIERVLSAFRERVRDLRQDRRLRYILLFKNHGGPAGATLEHPHSQLIALPIVPGAFWKPAGDENPIWLILGLLGGTIGLPYFLLSTTSPLVQVWFARARPGHSPYRLFALSNFASMLALVGYPFLLEPWAPTRAQAARHFAPCPSPGVSAWAISWRMVSRTWSSGLSSVSGRESVIVFRRYLQQPKRRRA